MTEIAPTTTRLSFLSRTKLTIRTRATAIFFVVRTLVDFFQTIMFLSFFSVRFSFPVEALFWTLTSIFSPNVRVSFAECDLGITPTGRLIFGVLLIPCAALFILIVYAFRYLFLRFVRKNQGSWSELNHTMTSSMMALCFLVFPLSAFELLAVTSCVETSDNDSYLFFDMRRDCSSEEFKRDQIIGSIFFCLLCVCLPFLGFLHLLKNARNPLFPKLSEPYWVVVAGYRSNFFFWEFFILLKKIGIVIIVTQLHQHPFVQCIAGMYVCVGFLFVSVWVKPITDPTLSALHTVAHMGSVLVFSVATLTQAVAGHYDQYTHMRKDVEAGLIFLMFLSVFGSLLLPLCFSVVLFFKQRQHILPHFDVLHSEHSKRELEAELSELQTQIHSLTAQLAQSAPIVTLPGTSTNSAEKPVPHSPPASSILKRVEKSNPRSSTIRFDLTPTEAPAQPTQTPPQPEPQPQTTWKETAVSEWSPTHTRLWAISVVGESGADVVGGLSGKDILPTTFAWPAGAEGEQLCRALVAEVASRTTTAQVEALVTVEDTAAWLASCAGLSRESQTIASDYGFTGLHLLRAKQPNTLRVFGTLDGSRLWAILHPQ
eukprot:TRINITY_DN4839_c0_g1_i4.p1 TRINITY_DN4839_c0_g1~~TRINITY_DN4839_c0_g1_i4.p1  ORF type:complete len:598 (-),score=156.88 TRINITY_DN4839_c0_g1_i4:46-1839(-)